MNENDWDKFEDQLEPCLVCRDYERMAIAEGERMRAEGLMVDVETNHGVVRVILHPLFQAKEV